MIMAVIYCSLFISELKKNTSSLWKESVERAAVDLDGEWLRSYTCFVMLLSIRQLKGKCTTVKEQPLFTESALRPIQSISRDVRMCVLIFVRHTLETTLPEGLETSGRMAYR